MENSHTNIEVHDMNINVHIVYVSLNLQQRTNFNIRILLS